MESCKIGWVEWVVEMHYIGYPCPELHNSLNV
jgi:hypothetical protein